ncbi:hypothetical protein LUZ63_009997 [Rhynchospora breviuscula]|uniref:Uncharacterized protein n=1 Tax=Rhynchospora breviuscula TaxID=2022672 RepID=A0A9Q0HP63_9POAL|nr:hypothetical protein LUZ63_009997 [Rhynchospora breviuscula]
MEPTSSDAPAGVPEQGNEFDDDACMYAWQLTTASIFPMTLKAALELDLIEILVAGCGGPSGKPTMAAADVASYLKARSPAAAVTLDRILRLLAAYNIVTCTAETDDDGTQLTWRYGPAPVCKWLTKNEEGVSLASLVLMNQDKVFMESWNHLKDTVLDGGIPFNKAYGMTSFEYFGKDARCNQLFNEGMKTQTVIITKKLIELYRGFDDVCVLVDVGGGIGATLHIITSNYNHIKGINFDLPHVICKAPALPGVEHVAGDMLEKVPSGDAILIKYTLHAWSDEHCVTILKNCYSALPDNGKVIIVERILPVNPEVTPASQGVFDVDLIMLLHTPGGKQRTKKEFEALSTEAGFSGLKATHVFANTWAIELKK